MTGTENAEPSAEGTMHQLRRARRASTVSRASKTRSSITSAVLTLSTAGRPVTVRGVVQEAGISRATFYTHFADLSEVIVLIHEQALAEVAAWQREALSGTEQWSEPDAQRESFRRFAQYVDEHRELYATIFALPIGSDVRRRSARVIAEALQERLDAVASPPPGIRSDVVTAALAAAYMHILALWVQGNLDLTVDDVMAHFLELMPPWLLDPDESAGQR